MEGFDYHRENSNCQNLYYPYPPIFLYRTSLISLDKEFVKEANKIIFDFIWKGKDKVKRSTLISDIEDGGLKAPHLNSIIETQRILCCKKLANDQPSGWKIILLHYLKPVGGKLVLCCDFDLKKLTIKLPAFYEECLRFFAKCSAVNNFNIQDLNGKDLSKVILWNNKFICVGYKSVYFRNLAEKGIFRVGDLISNKHEFINKLQSIINHWRNFCSYRTWIKSLLWRLKNIGMVSEKLYRNSLNGQNADIQFTKEIEENGKIPFSRLLGHSRQQQTTNDYLQKTDTYRPIARPVFVQPDLSEGYYYPDFDVASATGLRLT